MARAAWLGGADAQHRITNVLFENLRINGRLIADAEAGNFQIDPATTANVRFKVAAQQP